MFHAHITDGIVTSITENNGSLDGEQCIPIETFDVSLIGQSYSAGVFTPVAEAAKPYKWFIDIGPFFDRFGSAKMAILTSQNATVKAIISDLQVRKWVDLKRADVGQGIDALIAIGVNGVTAELKSSVLNTPVTADENLALRRLYF